jgi:hypothetical protein
MRFASYKCDADGCGIKKGENNHWFKFRAYPNEGNGAEFTVNDWRDPRSDYPNTKHLCSDACVIKTVQGWLSAQKEASQKGE